MEKRYYISLILGDSTAVERECTLEEFCNAEHQCGFYPKGVHPGAPHYNTTPATGGFSNGTVSGRIEYGPAEQVKLGKWQTLDGHGVGRVREGGDPDNIADRYAFIEKTPRVRVAPYTEDDHKNWKQVGWGGDYMVSRFECDGALTLLGYDLAE